MEPVFLSLTWVRTILTPSWMCAVSLYGGGCGFESETDVFSAAGHAGPVDQFVGVLGVGLLTL